MEWLQLKFRLVIGFAGNCRSWLQVHAALSLIHTHLSSLQQVLILVSQLCCLSSLPHDELQQCTPHPCSSSCHLAAVPHSQLCYDRRSIGKSVLVSGTHLGLMTTFLFLSDSSGFLDVRHRLWWEDGSGVYIGPHQRSHSVVRIPQDSWSYIFECPRFQTSHTQLYPHALRSLVVASYG
jgi:hypothetical protein